MGAHSLSNVIGALLAGYRQGHCCAISMASDVFPAWIADEFIPDLATAALRVMENAAFHKRCDTQQAISAAEHILEYLAPYSPDLDPIEHQ